MLLYGHVGQVYQGITQLAFHRRIACTTEACKPTAMHVDGQWMVGGDEYVEADVEFLAANEQRVVYVALHDVALDG